MFESPPSRNGQTDEGEEIKKPENSGFQTRWICDLCSFCQRSNPWSKFLLIKQRCRFAWTGVYTAYKPFLNKDEDIIKQLQKVSRHHHTSFMAHLICLNIVSTHVVFFLFFKRSSGSSAETSIRGPECYSAAILLGINTELHHSLGENLSNREIHSGLKVCTMMGKCPCHTVFTHCCSCCVTGRRYVLRGKSYHTLLLLVCECVLMGEWEPV